MHGYFESNTADFNEIFEIVRELQNYIESKEEDEPYQVTVSVGPYSMAIEIEGKILLCSEDDEWCWTELSYDNVINAFYRLCKKWNKYGEGK
jgi:hypothetical protein